MEIEAIRRQYYKYDGIMPSEAIRIRLTYLEDLVKRISQAQMDSYYVLESLNHLVFG